MTVFKTRNSPAGAKSIRRTPEEETLHRHPGRNEGMIQRILNSKNFVACLLAAATGIALYFKCPFPQGISFWN